MGRGYFDVFLGPLYHPDRYAQIFNQKGIIGGFGQTFCQSFPMAFRMSL